MMNLLCTIVRGDSAVKNGKASITARLGCQGRCVRGRGHLLGEVEEEGSFKDIMIWKVSVLDQAAGRDFNVFLVLAIRFVKIKSQSLKKKDGYRTILPSQHCIFKFR